MATPFIDLWNQLTAEVPGLSGPAAQQYIQNAYLEVQREHEWSFLHAEGSLIIPAAISTGTFNVTQFSQYVVPDASAARALFNLSTPFITKRQIRFGTTTAGPVYSIAGYDAQTFPAATTLQTTAGNANISSTASFTTGDVGRTLYIPGAASGGAELRATITAFIDANTVTISPTPTLSVTAAATTCLISTVGITLDRVYQDITASSVGYRCYRCYYEPCDLYGNPVTNFRRWVAAYDPRVGYPIQTAPPVTQADMPWMDVQRSATGNPRMLLPYKTITINGEDIPQYELWPHPLNASVINTLYVRQGVRLFGNTDVVPQAIPLRLIITRALIDTYRWAEANKATESELRRSAWLALMGHAGGASAEGNYRALLQKAISDDEDKFLTSAIYPRWRNHLNPAVNAAYLQKTPFSYNY